MDIQNILDKAIDMLGLDDVNKEDVAAFLAEAMFYVEVASVAKAGIDNLVNIFEADDLAPADRTKLLIANRKKIEDMKNG